MADALKFETGAADKLGMEPPVLKFVLKTSYGHKRFYPGDGLSSQFLELTGGKTFTSEQLDLFRRMGFRVEVQPYLVPYDQKAG
jgi:hypothetical protein